MQLSNCLSKNNPFLGPHCEGLGKIKDGEKTLLSYTDKGGWEILKLNVYQLFLRKLGGYPSTHLDYISKKINKLEITENIKDCHNRIENFWIKKNLIGLGNSPISQAKVICFAEKHGDICFRSGVAQLINACYREGDIILIEGQEADKEINSKDHQLTNKLKSDCIIRGWEPEKFEEINGTSFKKADSKYSELLNIKDSFNDIIEMEGQLTSKEIAAIQIRLDKLKENIKNLNIYFQVKSIENVYTVLDNMFEKWKKGELSSTGRHGHVFYAVILKILSLFEKKQESALYKNMTGNESAEIMKGVSVRNASLINEINKYRQNGRKIFVIAGASHLLEFPHPWESCREVKKCLKNNQFVVITRKRDCTTQIAELNSDLTNYNF